MVKRCLKCGEEKAPDAFHRWKKEDGRQPWCKPCRKAYDREYHARTRERRRETRRRHRAEFLRWFRDLKMSRPCADCGSYFPHPCMQFDHLPGAPKRDNVGTLMRFSSKQLILAEIEHCELVCANCHALRTFYRLGA